MAEQRPAQAHHVLMLLEPVTTDRYNDHRPDELAGRNATRLSKTGRRALISGIEGRTGIGIIPSIKIQVCVPAGGSLLQAYTKWKVSGWYLACNH